MNTEQDVEALRMALDNKRTAIVLKREDEVRLWQAAIDGLMSRFATPDVSAQMAGKNEAPATPTEAQGTAFAEEYRLWFRQGARLSL